MKIYVAGPYTPKTNDIHDAARLAQANTDAAIQAGLALIKLGHLPFIPHLTHYMHIVSKEPLPYEFYCEYDMAWLAHCDALFLLGHSKGADAELAWAIEHKLLIFYSLDEVPSNGMRGTLLPLRPTDPRTGQLERDFIMSRENQP